VQFFNEKQGKSNIAKHHMEIKSQNCVSVEKGYSISLVC